MITAIDCTGWKHDYLLAGWMDCFTRGSIALRADLLSRRMPSCWFVAKVARAHCWDAWFDTRYVIATVEVMKKSFCGRGTVGGGHLRSVRERLSRFGGVRFDRWQRL